MKTTLLALALLSLAGCATKPPVMPLRQAVDEALAEALANRPLPEAPGTPDAVLTPPEPAAPPEVPQARVSLSLNNVPARQFFLALTSGTDYTMLVHPGVTGKLSARMKDVTVTEALDAIRDMYDIDYEITGKRILVKMPALETKVFQVNYLNGSRKGNSDTRVSAGSLTDTPSAGAAGAPVMPTPSARLSDSSRVSTASDTDFWSEVKAALVAIIGTTGNGRSVVISPQSGVVVVRAMPKELRDISDYLKATQLSVERQVILEAKILEVQLSDGYQTGINWSGFRVNGNNRGSLGVIQPGSELSNSSSGAPLSSNNLASQPGLDLASAAAAGGTLFGLALQGTNFAALISFLETQGAVQVLSSPRISTLNNQKAVLKIGTDEFFVTGVSGGTTTPSAGGAITTTPNVTLRPFFSGVVLDVLPQIDGDGNIILHVRPSVSQVTTVNKNINLGSGGQLTLPLASSSASEADSVVRARNGQVIVIGGLMRQSGSQDRSQVPGLGNLPAAGVFFGNTSKANQKRELVILLKPTVVQNDAAWTDDVQKARQRVKQIGTRDSKEK